MTSATRSTLFPQIPTIAESGLKGYEAISWYAALLPAGTPQPIVNKLNSEIIKSLQAPDVKAKLAGLGLEVKNSSPDEFEKFMISDWKVWEKVIRTLGIRAD